MAALENILYEVFVHRFLIEENNSYEDLLVVIKNRYPNLRGSKSAKYKMVLQLSWHQEENASVGWNSRYRSRRCDNGGKTLL